MRNAIQLLASNVFVHFGQASPRKGLGDAAGHALVGGVFAAANRLAQPLADLDELLRPRRIARVRVQLFRAHEGRTDGSAELRAIWFARIAREGLRVLLAAGFAESVLRRVEVTGNASAVGKNYVFAIYHTPWGRVLALWLARQSYGVVFSAARWFDRAREAHVPCTWRGLRHLIERLRSGSSAAVTADHFGSPGMYSTAVSLLGREVHVSTGAARIAATAGVPIIPVMTRYSSGKLQIAVGAAIAVDEGTVVEATRQVTAAFEVELRRDPSGWEQAHRFLSAAGVSR